MCEKILCDFPCFLLGQLSPTLWHQTLTSILLARYRHVSTLFTFAQSAFRFSQVKTSEVNFGQTIFELPPTIGTIESLWKIIINAEAAIYMYILTTQSYYHKVFPLILAVCM
jgi:hypothetical protein